MSLVRDQQHFVTTVTLILFPSFVRSFFLSKNKKSSLEKPSSYSLALGWTGFRRGKCFVGGVIVLNSFLYRSGIG